MTILPPEYYQNDDVLFLSKDLLGKFLMTHFDGALTGGMIIETEAYRGPEDKGSHAYNNRKTNRNRAMFALGGICYVYRCYGIHNLFNIVTNLQDIPHAILIRAITPTVGLETMCKRRKKTTPDRTLTNGPGSLCQALGITTQHNGLPLSKPFIWVEDHGIQVSAETIIAGPRVGIDYAEEDALLPWRFRINKD